MQAEAASVALNASELRIVRGILDQVVPAAEVWIFGSRASGRSRPFSDLDLLIVRPRHLTWSQRAALTDAFEASELPFRVDVVEAAGLSLKTAARVESERIPLPP